MLNRDITTEAKDGKLLKRRPCSGHVLTLHSDMNRLFDDFFGPFDSLFPEHWVSGPLGYRTDRAFPAFNPKVDVKETEKEIRLTIELPGMDEKDIHVELEDDVLVIKGEKKDEREDKDARWHRIERHYGNFQRAFRLSTGVETDKIKATFKKGLLKVTLPKISLLPPKPRKISPRLSNISPNSSKCVKSDQLKSPPEKVLCIPSWPY